MSIARPVAFGAGGSTGAILHALYRWLATPVVLEAPFDVCDAVSLDWPTVLAFVRRELSAHWPALLLVLLLIGLRLADPGAVSVTVHIGGSRRTAHSRDHGRTRLAGYSSHGGLS